MFNLAMDIREIRLENARALAKKIDPTHPIKAMAIKLAKATSLISNYMGKTPKKKIGDQLAREIEDIFDLPRGWMDKQHLAEGDGSVSEPIPNYLIESLPDSPSEAEFVEIPHYNVNGDCGNGYLNDHVEVKGGLAFRRDWIRSMGWDPAYLLVVNGKKLSMWPTIEDGAVLLVNRKITTPEDGKVYLFNWSGEERIKRMFTEGGSTFRISSDNPNKTLFPDQVIDFKQRPDVSIIGQVVWRAGTI